MVSNWREDLREIVDEIETKAEKKVKETKGINNKVVINPKLDEAVKEIGGELLEVKEVDVDQKIKDREKEKEDEKKNKEDNAIKSLTPTGAQEDPSLKQKEKQANNMKKRVLLQKLRAVRSGAGDSIMASHEPEGEVIAEKDLNAAERRALPNKDFVFPGKGEGPEGKQRGAYPINDKKHARAALAMAAAHASPEKEAKVKAAVKKKYPDIEVSEATLMDKIKKWKGKKKPEKKATMDATTDKLHDWRQKNSPEQKDREEYVSFTRPIVKEASAVLDANTKIKNKEDRKKKEKEYARLMSILAHQKDLKKRGLSSSYEPEGEMVEGKGYQPEIEHSKLGDAKKKADKERESKLPPHLQGDAIGKMKKAFASEAVKGQDREMRKMAAQDRAAGKDKRLSPKEGRRSVKPVRYRYNEADDKAYNYVVGMLKKKYGDDAVLTKGQKPKPPTAAQQKKNAEIRAKRAKEDGRDATEKASDGRYSDRYSNRGSD